MPLESVDRPVVQRTTSRVLLVEPAGRVLLFEDSDPLAPGAPSFWITPGGGLEPDESSEEAALREIVEETGLHLRPTSLDGPVAERTVVHGYADKIAVQTEIFFRAACPLFDVSPTSLTEDEKLTFRGHRWWSTDELRATSKPIWPVGLADLVDASRSPSIWPVALSTAEESTVASDGVVGHPVGDVIHNHHI